MASFALTLLGPTFKLPEWALGISPLHHVPNVAERVIGTARESLQALVDDWTLGEDPAPQRRHRPHRRRARP